MIDFYLIEGILKMKFVFLIGALAFSPMGYSICASKPNIVFIFTDDQGYSDVSMYGQKDVRTPNIDRIATEGVRFSRMRSNCTVCSPSRAAVLTGCFPDRVGVPGVIRTQPEHSFGYLKPDAVLLPAELKKAGYHTAIVGKWHLGLQSPNLPNDRGFDDFHGFLGDMMESYTTHQRDGQNYMRQNKEVITPAGHATDLFTQWACTYISERAKEKQPFFLYLAYNAPHVPIQPPPDYLARVKERNPTMKPKRAGIVALIEHLDDGIGKVLSTLDELNLSKDTLVIFGSDNGGALEHGSNNAPWLGGKQDHYDGGLCVPFAMRYPALIKAGATSAYTGQNFDIFPTCLELAGLPLPAGIDAKSLVPILQGGTMPVSSRELYAVRREGNLKYCGKSYEAIICDGWKLMQNDPFSPFELYNLTEDPGEKNNCFATEKVRANALGKRLQWHIQRGGSTPWQK
jgi:arylsulfatase A-like enzyme